MSKASVQLRNGADELDAPSRHPAGKNTVPRAEVGGSLPGASQEQELAFEEKRLRNDRTDTARSEQADQGSKGMDEKNYEMAHRRMVAGRGILRNRG